MHRRSPIALSLAGLALVLAAAGCGGSGAVTGTTEEAPPPIGHAVIAGTVAGGGVAASSGSTVHALSGDAGLVVTVVGTPLQGAVDEEGEFALLGVPAGTVTLHFEGPGADARLTVSGLVDGKVMALQIHLSGAKAETTSPPACSPTRDVKFTGILEKMSATSLVVGGRAVDLSALQKVWRNGRRTTFDDLQVGEKIKVWGQQRGDGVMLADEIEAGTFGPPAGDQQVSFRGVVQSVTFPAFGAARLRPRLVLSHPRRQGLDGRDRRRDAVQVVERQRPRPCGDRGRRQGLRGGLGEVRRPRRRHEGRDRRPLTSGRRRPASAPVGAAAP